MNQLANKYLQIICILIIIFSFGTFECYGQDQVSNEFDEVYNIGKQIAEGVALSIVTGLSLVDQDLEYSFTAEPDIFTYQENTWPILDVIVETQSKKIGDSKITFVLVLEIEKSSNVVVGTVKNVKVNGQADESLNILNNTMYIETEEGTKQVQLINGQLSLVK